MLRSVTVAGAGLAGLRAAATLRAEGFDGSLTVVGHETHLPYDRPPLSKGLLAGKESSESIVLPLPDDLDATWHLGDPATHLDPAARVLTTSSGRTVEFDGLVIATGSTNRTLAPDRARARARRVHSLRTVDDALAFRTDLQSASRLIIVGAGLVALEVASVARALGVAVEIVTVDRPLMRLGSAVADTCEELLVRQDVRVCPGRRVRDVMTGDDTRVSIRLDDGSVHTADLLLVAVGAVPTTDWLLTSGLLIEQGLVCDESLAVRGASHVVAAGDIARWPHPLAGGQLVTIGHWSNAIEQGAAAARTLLAGRGQASAFATVPSFWSDHLGRRLSGIGLPELADRHTVVGGTDDPPTVVLGHQGDRLVCATTYDGARRLAPYRAQILHEIERAPMRSPAVTR